MREDVSQHQERWADEDVFVLGLRRSGIHAILAWLIPHFDGMNRLINDTPLSLRAKTPLDGKPIVYVSVRGGRASELAFCHGDDWHIWRYLRTQREGFVKRYPTFLRPFARRVLRHFRTYGRRRCLDAQMIPYMDARESAADRNIFIVENLTPGEFAVQYAEWKDRVYQPFLNERGWTLPRRMRVISIIREPWNQLASMIQVKSGSRRWLRPIKPPQFREKWLRYASELLEPTPAMLTLGDVVTVSYPSWFSNADYRRHLAEQIGAPPTDSGLEIVSSFGGGSSFDKQTQSGKAQAMDVENRWRKYEDHDLMKGLLADEQIQTLSERIFSDDVPKPWRQEG